MKMRRLTPLSWSLLVILVSAVTGACLFGCATFQNLTPQQKTLRILDDAGWGVAAACDQEWLTAADCTLAADILKAARAAAGDNPLTALPAAQRVIADWDAKLPIYSKLHAFFQYILKITF